jgi:hypothetical protein
MYSSNCWRCGRNWRPSWLLTWLADPVVMFELGMEGQANTRVVSPCHH